MRGLPVSQSSSPPVSLVTLLLGVGPVPGPPPSRNMTKGKRRTDQFYRIVGFPKVAQGCGTMVAGDDGSSWPAKRMCLGVSSFRGPRKSFLDRFQTCSTTDCSTADCSTADCSTADCSTADCSTADCSTADCSTADCSTADCSTADCSTADWCGSRLASTPQVAPDSVISNASQKHQVQAGPLESCGDEDTFSAMETTPAAPPPGMEPVPAFQIIHQEEKGLVVEASHLVWAYDTLNHGWWRLVPFDVKGLSVFGLAVKAREWSRARKANYTREAACYNVNKRCRWMWTEGSLRQWLKQYRSGDDRDAVGFVIPLGVRLGRCVIPLANVDAAANDLLCWRLGSYYRGTHVGAFRNRVNYWWAKRGRYFGEPQDDPLCFRVDFVSLRELEGFYLKKLGDLKVPLEDVPKETRRVKRRQRIREQEEELGRRLLPHGLGINGGTSHLVGISGHRFAIVVDEERQLRIEPTYLVWAYDVLNHGWWNAVPPAVATLPSDLSVFGLAEKARDWVEADNIIYTLSTSCYRCGENGQHHGHDEECERCEKSWNPEEFWEWLASRHFKHICDQSRDSEQSTDSNRPLNDANRFDNKLDEEFDELDPTRLSEMINAVGFELPEGYGEWKLVVPAHEYKGRLFLPARHDSFGFRFLAWWRHKVSKAACKKSLMTTAAGYHRWEYERLVLYRINSRSELQY
ncbi:hypothetical protein GNI_133630 [Gregarina niphandrodes]|uniref:Uncharacterized protein n=1 Tax=Gregarina niphandrodes TaxID=110365 RepID=A0A023B1F2_GRENI|nr:hypothetical protein GNI_133630 [Gregarina niphandrodes]EZG46522.1 hypothetical protein GNI_133630 [Gregarina niphandrodes]|eukprot:XP_011132295.1 hypothetical protein GNI_133630 [Gregarina niphandrodes]